jgi:putative ABC transport system permease protein
MLSPRWRKVWRDLWSNKTRTILVVISIAVGIFAIGIVAGSRVVLSRDFSESYAAVTPASATLVIESFDDDLIQTIRRMPEVRLAEGRRRLTARVKIGPDQWRTLQMVALGDFTDITINKLRLVRGVWPPPKRELLLERSALSLLAADVGSEVVVELADGTQRTLGVAGLAHDLSQPATFFTNAINAYVSLDTIEWLGEPHTYNELSVVINGETHTRAEVERIIAKVRDKIEKSGYTIIQTTVPVPHQHPLDSMIRALILILGTLGFLSLFLSVFLVLNTISALLTQQVRQIGVMKAVGARADQVARMYIGMVLVFGALSLIVAVPLGLFGTRAITAFIAGLLNFDVTTVGLPVQVLGLQAVTAIVVPPLAALWPILKGARITVREAIASYGVESGGFGTGPIDALVSRVRIFSRPLLLSLRNTIRRKARLSLTLATLTLSGAIFIAVASVRASALLSIDETISTWNHQLRVTFSQTYRIERLVSEALAFPGVVRAEGWLVKTGLPQRPDGSEGNSMIITALPAATDLYRPRLREGRWLQPGDANAIVIDSGILKDEPELTVGSTLVLKIDGREIVFQVVGIVMGQMQGAVAYVDYPSFVYAAREAGRANRLAIALASSSDADETRLAQTVEQQLQATGLRVRLTETRADLRLLTTTHYNVVILLLLIMAIVLGVVGGLGLMGTMSLNVLERTREIGLMRAIGASNQAILQIVIVEGILIGVFSWFLGLILAFPLSKVLSDAVGIAMLQVPLSYTFSFGGVLLWLGLVIVLAAVASSLPAWNASRLTVKDVLAYE